MRSFQSLQENEVLALAIFQEEEDAKIFGDFAEGLRQSYPATAEVFERMRREEEAHRQQLVELYRKKFGEHIPLIRKQDIKGFIKRRPVWLMRPLGIETVRKEAESIEAETALFYESAAKRTSDLSMRDLFVRLAEIEKGHQAYAREAAQEHLTEDAKAAEEKTQHRLFVLQVIQPGLAGLMDGSVSTLAPLFAAAFATHNSWDAFLVGLAASVGAGISMGFAEALSDDGSLTGRGHPWIRGLVCGIMTTLGGIGHTLPYLIPDFMIATTIAAIVVLVELAAISWIRYKYMDTPLLTASFQVVVGGVLVFLAGIIIGTA
jgi:erythrin-vacuolar iron transport family protein